MNKIIWIKYSTIAIITLSLLLTIVPTAHAQQNLRIKKEATTSGKPLPVRESVAIILQAKLDSVSAKTLTISKDGKVYTVNVGIDTKTLRRFGGKSDLIEYSVGNTISVWGTYTDANKSTINARVIRNMSIQKRNGVFFGSVKSTAAGTFVLSSKGRGDQIVTISASTKIVNRKGSPITGSDIKIADHVRVHGLWDRSLNKITEVKMIKDFSQPEQSAKPSTTASASATPAN